MTDDPTTTDADEWWVAALRVSERTEAMDVLAGMVYTADPQLGRLIYACAAILRTEHRAARPEAAG